MATIAEAIRDAAARLAPIADNPHLEARLLLAQALGITRNDIVRDPGRVIEASGFQALVTRRTAREPLAFIVGHREFWSLDFRVSPATLIPRPDSETLVEAALAAFAHRPPPIRVLDIGTGTGCLLLALLKEFPAAFGIGLDVAPDAAALAQSNAIQLGLADRSAFMVGDWTNAIAGQFDLIISNPPYICSADIVALMPEVACHEPSAALDGGADGYGAYRAIMPAIVRHLARDGAAILEVGVGQAGTVAGCAHDQGLDTSIRLDLAGVPRAITLTWQGC